MPTYLNLSNKVVLIKFLMITNPFVSKKSLCCGDKLPLFDDNVYLNFF